MSVISIRKENSCFTDDRLPAEAAVHNARLCDRRACCVLLPFYDSDRRFLTEGFR